MVICVYLCLSVVAVSADTIILKNGSSIEGSIVKDDGTTVTLAVRNGKIFIDHSEIESIIKAEYKPEPLEEEPPEIEPAKRQRSPVPNGTKPVTSTPVTPTSKASFKITDEGKTPEQKKINSLLRQLATKTQNTWQIVLWLVKEAKNDIPYMLGLLKEIKDPALRRWLIHSLGRTEDISILEPLRPELKHPDERVRKVVVEALKHFKDPSLQAEFKELLEKETSPKVRCALIKALTSWQDRSIIPGLIDLLSNRNKTLRYVVSQSLVNFFRQAKRQESPDFDVPALLIKEIAFAKPILKKEILTLLGQLKDRRSLEVLTELLTDGDVEVRSLAAMALTDIADKKIIQFLQERLSEETDVWVRIQIMQVFQKSRDYDTIPILIETLKDPEENIRFAASRSLRTITKRSFGADYERWQKWWDKLQGK